MTVLIYLHYGWRRVMQLLPASVLGAMLFSRCLHTIDIQLMRLSHYRLSIPTLLTGLPVILLASTGARSGQTRTTPVIGVPDGEAIILIASNWGQHRHPAWYYNVRANPVATLHFSGQTGSYTAHEVTDPAEYHRLWTKATEIYLGFTRYQQRAGTRTIPIVRMTPD